MACEYVRPSAAIMRAISVDSGPITTVAAASGPVPVVPSAIASTGARNTTWLSTGCPLFSDVVVMSATSGAAGARRKN